MEPRRTLLAVVLTFAVILVWSVIFPPPPPPAPVPAMSPSPVAGPAASGAAGPSPAPGGSPSVPPVGGAEMGPPSPLDEEKANKIGDSVEREVTIETDLFRVGLSNRGGVARSWSLSRYRAHEPRPGASDAPVELVSPDRGPSAPLAIASGDPALDAELAGALFSVEGQDARLGPGQRARVAFRWADGRGARVEKVLTFEGGSYVVGIEVAATVPAGTPRLLLAPGFAPKLGDEQMGSYGGRAAVRAAGKVHRRAGSDVSMKRIRKAADDEWPPRRAPQQVLEAAEEVRRLQGVDWAGVENNYFAALLFSSEPFPGALLLPVVETLEAPPAMAVAVDLPPRAALSLFVGPKDGRVLEGVRPDLVEVIDYGWFALLARWLLAALQFFERFVHNYGVAIILLTVVIKLLLLPLTIKQLSSMQKMARIAPQVRAIQEKYARPPADMRKRMEANQRKQQEVMELYRREGVNPVGGCLPLLPQLPVMYGFYALLSVSIELRHAPFVLWVQDLSAPDPFYVTPILMLVSMIVQQAITPTSVDPMQRKMMYIMPVVFFWVFKDLASGLVLYWLTQNVLSIIQQAITNRITQRREEQAKEQRRQGKAQKAHKGVEAG